VETSEGNESLADNQLKSCGWAEVSASLYQAMPLNAQAFYRVLLELPKVGVSLMNGAP